MNSNETAAAWDARDRLVHHLKREEWMPTRTLYLRLNDGGALAVALLPGHQGILLITLHADTYDVKHLLEPELIVEPYQLKAEGFGGVFGIGEKGANGWTLQLLERGVPVAETQLLPAITSFADLLMADDRYLNGKRKPRQIPLWQLKPEDRGVCENVLTLWIKLVRGGF